MDRSLGGIQAETLLGRLAAKDRQARGVELRKQRNAARKEQKARLSDPTLDMFADWVTHETRGETAGQQAA